MSKRIVVDVTFYSESTPELVEHLRRIPSWKRPEFIRELSFAGFRRSSESAQDADRPEAPLPRKRKA